MRVRSFAIIFICMGWAVSAAAQAPRPQLAREVFKNVPSLGEIPVDEFMDTMGMFSAALSFNCTDCHKVDNWAAFAEELPLKQAARRMIAMVNTINRSNFGGRPVVSCYTCHHGDQKPKIIPSLTQQYGVPVDDPNEVEVFPQTDVDPVFTKYIQALGGAQRLSALTTFTARGTYSGYDTDQQAVPVEIYAKAPNQRTTVVHMIPGDSVRVFDGRNAWIAAPDKPSPLMPLTGGNLEGAKIEALLSFPAQIRQAYAQWQMNSTIIDDRDVTVLRGTNPDQPPINLYFDDESGLLVRVLRYVETRVGPVPTQVDLTDYRDVAGVKMPFEFTVTWTNGQATTKLTEIQPNPAIDAARFNQPSPAPPPKLQ